MARRVDMFDERSLAVSLWQVWNARDMKRWLAYPRIDDLASRVVNATPTGSHAIISYIDAVMEHEKATPKDDAEKAQLDLEFAAYRIRLAQFF